MKKIMLLVFTLCVFEIHAQDLKKNEFSISLGYMFEGEIYMWEQNFYGSVGETILFKAEYDHYFSVLAGRFGLGPYYCFGIPYYNGYEEIMQHEIGAVLKFRFNAGDKFQIKPGAYFGFRAYGDNAGTGFGINGSVSLQYQVSEKIKPFIDLGIMSQPAGGNDATDITYSPTFQASVGVTF
jgi:hypothetical protein